MRQSYGRGFALRTLVLASALLAFALAGPSAVSPPAPESAVAAPPAGFVETTVFSGLTNPTVVRFAGDGRVFVAEKSGVIKVFDSVLDTTPSLFTDLSTTDGTPNNVLATNVHNFWDRGLLGMALHANFPTTPYVYVLYTHDAAIGGTAPRWGSPGAVSDGCPTPPGPTSDGCVVSGRLSRLQAAGNVMTGSEQVLVEDWCQQYPSHSTGTVEFGPDGALYASAGDGASFGFADYGQDGSPLNPCGDPPGGVGGVLTPPTAEGGALRSQDLRTAGDPVTLDGSIIRVDPTTGAALPSNPLFANPDANAKRIIAHGLRNPFRFTFRPGTSELWIGDVGWNEYEEINRVLDPTDTVVENFGWPCYEGSPRQSGYDAANLSVCENLYSNPGADTKPYFAYHHANKVDPADTCPTGSSSIAGLAFEFAPESSSYPAEYQGALFFADYSRDCIWVMKKNGNPIPAPGQIDPFVNGAANPVNIEFGPDGNLYYADFDGGTIRRIAPEATSPPNSYLSDLTWTSMTNGWGPAEKDMSNGDLSQGDGLTLTLNGTTYAKGIGAHADSDIRYFLGGNCSRFKSSVGLDDEVGALGSVVFEVYADTTKVYDSGVMTGTTATNLIDVSVAGANELRLVVTFAGDNPNHDHADWALARVECGGGGDITPPTVVGQTPGSGATGVAVNVSPTATFSEAMDPATITTGTFTLVQQGQSTPLPASISYASQVATLDPTSNLLPGTSYTATVEGGTSGVEDVAGNALLSDFSWTFTTAASANQPPSPVIDTPASSVTWKVGDAIGFAGHATDPEQGTLPASALSWTLLLQHCPSTCHTHPLQSWPGASGSFNAPDHDYPSHLDLQLTATDAAGASVTTTRRLDPQTVVLSFASQPSGLELAVDSTISTTPFTRQVIIGSTNSLSAPSPQTQGGTSYVFSSWSDGGAQTHNITAPAAPLTYTATYMAGTQPPQNTALPDISGQTRIGRTLTVSNGTWTGSLPMGFSYQWLRCTATALSSCTAIAGPTSNAYVLVAADRDMRIRATVTATNTVGSASATSNATGKIK